MKGISCPWPLHYHWELSGVPGWNCKELGCDTPPNSVQVALAITLYLLLFLNVALEAVQHMMRLMSLGCIHIVEFIVLFIWLGLKCNVSGRASIFWDTSKSSTRTPETRLLTGVLWLCLLSLITLQKVSQFHRVTFFLFGVMLPR